MNSRLFILALASLLIAGSLPATAGTPKASPSPTAAEPDSTPSDRPLPFSGKIFSVDKATRTFSTENKEKKVRIFSVTPQSKLTKTNNSTATLEELKPGMEVRGSALKKGNGRFEVLSAKIGPAEDVKKVTGAVPAASALPAGKKAAATPAR